MNKTGLIDAISEKTGMTKKDSGKALEAVLDIISDALKEGESVQLIGFGTFYVQTRPEREGRNPATEEKITIPAANVPKFKAGNVLKKTIN